MTTTTTIPAVDVTPVLGDDRECAERLAAAWQRADLHPHYPASTETVASLLHDGCGLDIDEPSLSAWGRTGQVQGVRIVGGKFVWSPLAIAHAIARCELLRRWLPLNPLHTHKLTAAELAQAQAAAVGESVFTDLDQVAVRDLVAMLARHDDPAIRNLFAVALRAKLASLGVDA